MSKVSRFAICLLNLFVLIYTIMDILLHVSNFDGISLLSLVTIIVILLLLAIVSALWFAIEWHDSFN